MKIKHLLLFLGLAAIVGWFTSFGFNKPAEAPTQQTQQFGSAIPVVPSLFQTSLATSMSTTDNSMTLASGTDRQGNNLSGYICFTLDSNTSTTEYVCGTANGTSVTSLVRGIDPITGTTTVASLTFSHRRGADVRVTDYPSLGILSRILNGNDTLPNPVSYVGSLSTSTIGSNSNYLASVGYVNSVSLQGGPTATTTVPGVVQIGTTSQIAAGTGMTGAYTLVPAGSLFSQAWRSATTVPVTSATGTLATGFIDQTANYTWSGTQTFNASSTVALNGTISFGAVPAGLGIINNFTASTTLTGATLPQPVVMATTTGAIVLASSTSQTFVDFMGFAISNASNGQTVKVQTDGIVGGFTGLTVGADYYVSNTSGTVSTTPGTYEIKVGTAISTTQILIKKVEWQYMGSASFSGAPSQSVTVPPLARFAIVTADGGGSSIAAHGSIVLAKYGATGGTQGSKGTSADNDSTVSASWSGSTISISGNGMTNVSGNVYFYR